MEGLTNHAHRALLPLVLANVPAGLRLALAQEGVPAVEWADEPHGGRFVLYDSQQAAVPPLAMGQCPIDVAPLRQGRGDPFAALVDFRAARQVWRMSQLELQEEVARVDKRSVREQLLMDLRQMLHKVGGVWLRVAAFPFPYRSAFNLRLDYDECVPADVASVLQALAGWESATTHFVNAGAYHRQAAALQPLRGLDVGSHGFWHHTYQNDDENLQNIQRGIAALRGMGFEPCGFAAPHGRWSPGLASALESLEISHSSEFSLAYDELPFFPWLPSGRASDVLQIPVHPICLGLFLEATARQFGRSSFHGKQAAEAAASHYAAVARAKYAAGEPILMYGHPERRLGRYPQVLKRLIGELGSMTLLWSTTYRELNHWWRSRSGIRLRVQQTDAETLQVEWLSAELPYRLALELVEGRHVASVPLDNRHLTLNRQSLLYQARAASSVPRVIRIDQAHPLRERVRRYLDWERVTPVEEIGTRHWRGRLKRWLRQVQDREAA